MIKKLVRKIALVATLACMATSVVAATACNIETKHPKVKITVEFNHETYELDYTLYRNMYPNTVRHFIELADSGIYDNIIVHDYQTSDWLSGAFGYVAEDYVSAMEDSSDNPFAHYLAENSIEDKYMELFNGGKLTPTVYAKEEIVDGEKVIAKDSAMPTLIGEFANNIGQTIEQGSLSASKGTLKMYYYAKETTQKVFVTPKKDSDYYFADYKSNCATSTFAMQVGSTSNSINAAGYCVFGKMDSTNKLDSLLDAIADYYANSDDSKTKTAIDVPVDNWDEYSTEAADRGIEVNFALPTVPIVIKTVKVTKH